MAKKIAMSFQYTLADAKNHLSALISAAEGGAEIDITRHGKVVARIVGAPKGIARTAGDWGWTGTYDKSVFAPMTEQEMRDEGWPVWA